MTLKTRGFVAALLLLVAVVALFSITGKLTDGSAEEKDGFGQILVPLSDVKNYDVILDVSPNATQYIPGAINLN